MIFFNLLKILTLNDSSIKGGAAKACNRACDSLKASGHEIISVSQTDSKKWPQGVVFG